MAIELLHINEFGNSLYEKVKFSYHAFDLSLLKHIVMPLKKNFQETVTSLKQYFGKEF